MLKAGGPAAISHALSASRQGPFRATHRGLQVVCGSGQAGDSGLPGLAPDQQRRALTVPSGAQHINWREFGDSLGGSLIVDNASHKEEVHKVGGPGGIGSLFRALLHLPIRSCRQPLASPPRAPMRLPLPHLLLVRRCWFWLQAVKEGTLSFGFSAGGCLFPYYIGCAGALMDAGILTGVAARERLIAVQ